MKSLVAAAGLAFVLSDVAHADPATEARALYDRFAAAENANDFDALGSVLLDSPQFLWVTNGLSTWGREAAVRRMADYHTAEIWHIEPDDAKAVAVGVSPASSFLHVPLELSIGSKADGPDHFHFLVSALCMATSQGWRIAALFTTMENRE